MADQTYRTDFPPGGRVAAAGVRLPPWWSQTGIQYGEYVVARSMSCVSPPPLPHVAGRSRDVLKVLIAFHHQAARQITGMTAKHGAGGEWGYAIVEEAMDSAGIHPIIVYIKRRQTSIEERVAFRPVYAF